MAAVSARDAPTPRTTGQPRVREAGGSPDIDDLLASGEITDAQAEQYREALEEAFTFRVDWDGEPATPTFSGLDA